MNRNRGSARDLCAAIFALTLGVCLSAWAFAAIREIEQPSQGLFEPLQRGTTVYFARTGDICVGRFETIVLELEREVQVSLKGSLNMRYGDRAVRGDFYLSSYFNPLGQMQQSLIKLSAGDDLFSLETRAVNPIVLKIAARIGGQTYKLNDRVPGPVLLRQVGQDQFQFDYKLFPNTSTRFAALAGRNLAGQIGFSLHRASEPGACKKETEGALDLGGALQLLGDVPERLLGY